MSVSAESIINQNGHAVVILVDHLGQRYTETLFVPVGWSQAELDAHGTTRAAALAERLAEIESQEVVG